MGKSAKNTASTTKDNIKTQYREKNNRETQQKNTAEKHSRKTQQRKIAENENRAYNNHIETGRTEKQFLFPRFCPQRHEKIHG